MLRCLNRSGMALLLVLALAPVTRGAVPSSEVLFPNTTKGYLSVANVDQLSESWARRSSVSSWLIR